MSNNTFRYAGEFEEQEAVIVGWPRIIRSEERRVGKECRG